MKTLVIFPPGLTLTTIITNFVLSMPMPQVIEAFGPFGAFSFPPGGTPGTHCAIELHCAIALLRYCAIALMSQNYHFFPQEISNLSGKPPRRPYLSQGKPNSPMKKDCYQNLYNDVFQCRLHTEGNSCIKVISRFYTKFPKVYLCVLPPNVLQRHGYAICTVHQVIDMIGPVSFHLFNSSKILITAFLVRLFLKRRISTNQWMSRPGFCQGQLVWKPGVRCERGRVFFL